MSYSGDDSFAPISTSTGSDYVDPAINDVSNSSAPTVDPSQQPVPQPDQQPVDFMGSPANAGAYSATQSLAEGAYHAPDYIGAIGLSDIFGAESSNPGLQTLNKAMGYDDPSRTNPEPAKGSGGTVIDTILNTMKGVSPDEWVKLIGSGLSGLEMNKIQNRALDIKQQEANDNSTLVKLKAQQQANESHAGAFNMGILAKNMTH